jgi:endogenous inhibitor of DNA gyrase (YacG/DUF329 family)
LTGTEIGPGAAGMSMDHIKVCARCGLRYDWRKSPSTTLKMTYCSSLCEKADLGYTIEALLRFERPEPKLTVESPDDAPKREPAPAV